MNRVLYRVVYVLVVGVIAIPPPAGATAAASGTGSRGPALTSQCAPAPTDLVSWWPGDGTADDIQDGNHGISVNGVDFTTGKVGQAFSFDGVDDSVEVDDSPNLRLAGSLTVEAWISLQSLPPEFAPVVSKWNDIGVANRGYFLAVLPDGRVRFDVSTNGRFGSPNSEQVVSSARVPLNVFTHVAATFDAGSGMLRVYLDGAESASVRAAFSRVFSHRDPLRIGAGDLGGNTRDFFRGAIDEVAIYGRALSGGEIAAIFSAGSAGKCKPAQDEPSAPAIPEEASITLRLDRGPGATYPVGSRINLCFIVTGVTHPTLVRIREAGGFRWGEALTDPGEEVCISESARQPTGRKTVHVEVITASGTITLTGTELIEEFTETLLTSADVDFVVGER